MEGLRVFFKFALFGYPIQRRLIAYLYRNSEQIARDIFIILLSLIVIESIFYLWIDNIFFRGGYIIVQMQKVALSLTQENIGLEAKIADQSSLRVIEEKSKKKGFKEAQIQWMK